MFDYQGHFSRRNFLRSAGGLALLSLSGVSKAREAPDEMTIRYFAQGYSPALRHYLTNVMALILDKSVPEYGPYRLELFTQSLSASRTVLEVSRGEKVDIAFSSSWAEQAPHAAGLIKLDCPVFFGLLGLRHFITRRDFQPMLQGIQSRAEMSGLVYGQGAHWLDTGILQLNGLNTVEAQRLESLFPMLNKRRFDVLPLSVLEAEDALATVQEEFPELVLNDGLALFYPMPFQLLVHPLRRTIADRFAHGLTLAMQDGTLHSLFNQNFSRFHEQIELKRSKLLLLANSFLPPAESERISTAFLERYGGYFEQLPSR